jgi:hypothetical protein
MEEHQADQDQDRDLVLVQEIKGRVILVLVKSLEINQEVETIPLIRDMESLKRGNQKGRIQGRVADTEERMSKALTVLHLWVIWVSWLQGINRRERSMLDRDLGQGHKAGAVLLLRVIWVPLVR